MRNTFQGLEAYGHGGDLAYAASSWYITDRDISISVLMNHNGLTSWSLLPVVSALLKTYNNWLLLTSAEDVVPSQVTLRVYPNPCTDFTTVSFPALKESGDLQLVLRNALGQTVQMTSEFTAASGGTVCRLNDLGSLSAGIYLIQLLKDGEIIGTSRLVR